MDAGQCRRRRNRIWRQVDNMTVRVSKQNYGVVLGPSGLTVSKQNYGVIIGPAGLTVSKINYGVIIDTNVVATGRRRQMVNN